MPNWALNQHRQRLANEIPSGLPRYPVDGLCPEPLIWVQTASALPLTYAEFVQRTPALVAVLLSAWGIKKLVKLVFNHR